MITIKCSLKGKNAFTESDFSGFSDAKDYLRTINFRNCYVIIRINKTRNESVELTEEREAIRTLRAFCE